MVAFAPLAGSTATAVPAVKDLVLRYAGAMHYENIARIRSRTMTASGFIDNRVVTFTTMAKAPDKILEIITVDGTGVRESVGFDGTTAWAQLPSGAVVVFDGAASRWIEGLAFGFAGDPRDIKATDGVATIRGVEYYVISLRDGSGFGRDVMLDEKTYLPAYWRLIAGGSSHLFDVGPLDTGPLGESYPRILQTIGLDGSIGQPASVTSVDDNISLPDSMFAPPVQQ